MSEEDKEGKEDAKSIAEQFLGTLGLVDIVLGSLGLYLVRLHLGEHLADSLPTTDVQAADLLLMATAAALLGKAIALAALIPFAICRACAMWDASTSGPIRAATSGDGMIGDEVDRAECLVLVRKPKLHAELQKIRTQAILAFGATIIGGAYAWHFWAQRRDLANGIAAAAAIVFVLGILQSVDFVGQLGRLATLILTRRQSLKASQGLCEQPKEQVGSHRRLEVAPPSIHAKVAGAMAFVLLVGAGAWHFMGAVAAAMVFVACVLLVARKAWLARRRSNRSRTLQAGSGQPASDMATPLASHAADASLAPRDEPAFTPPPPTHQGQPQDVVGEQPGDTQSTGALNPAALPAGEKGATTAPPEPISDSVDAKPRDVSGSAERPHDKDAK